MSPRSPAPSRLRLQLIGYWAGGEPDGAPAEWPHPRSLVTRWKPAERERVVAYLTGGHVLAHYLGSSWCRFGCQEPNGSAELWDGTYVWPEGLAHYVGRHSVGLPDTFVRHIEAHAYAVPGIRVAPDERPDVSTTEFLRWAASRAAPKPARVRRRK
jgi:hypothetical protein